MIVVCPQCGQKNRIRLVKVVASRCGKCSQSLHADAERQAARNADCMLAIASLLWAIPPDKWSKDQLEIVKIIYHYQRGGK